MSKAIAIIQARFGATRLPGKVLLKVMGKTILEYVVERVRKAGSVEDVIVATTTAKEDLRIVDLINGLKINVYRGSKDDVLDRFYQAARLFGAKDIIRVTADCPLIDPEVIDNVANYYFKSGADYCSNILEETFPDGQDVEIFSFYALSDAWKNAKALSEREHVTPYIRKNPDRFKLGAIKNKMNLGGKRWTLDQKEDFEFIKTILESLYPSNPDFNMEDVLKFLRRHPEVENINRGIPRNEGYQKSLKADKTTDINYTKE